MISKYNFHFTNCTFLWNANFTTQPVWTRLHNFKLSLIIFLLLPFSNSTVLAATRVSSNCNEALFASGMQWLNTRNSPLKAIHPAYSNTAEAVYYSYDIGGVRLFLEFGKVFTKANGEINRKLEKIFLEYKPDYFMPFSFFSNVLGKKPILIHHSGSENIPEKLQRDLHQNHSLSNEEDDDIWTIYPESGNDNHPLMLIISKSTGRLTGYPKSKNGFFDFTNGLWVELRRSKAANKYGRGKWYNSNSGMESPFANLWSSNLEFIGD